MILAPIRTVLVPRLAPSNKEYTQMRQCRPQTEPGVEHRDPLSPNVTGPAAHLRLSPCMCRTADSVRPTAWSEDRYPWDPNCHLWTVRVGVQ